jgi:hypothetical protein
MLSNVELISRLVLPAALGSATGFERERLSWAAGLCTQGTVREFKEGGRLETARVRGPGVQACDNAASKTHAAAFPLRGAKPGRFIGRVSSRSRSRPVTLSIIDLCQIPL